MTPVAGIDDVYQLETTDPVLGGPGGIANRQAQNLLNRTAWLIARLNAINPTGTAVPLAVVSGAGSAAGLNAGTTAGNVMPVGAFGLGGTGETLDTVNDNAKIGFFAVNAGATGMPSGEAGNGMLIAWRGTQTSVGGTTIVQVLITSQRVYVRQHKTDTLALWQAIGITDDVGLVGAFAHSGTPTGWLTCNGALVSRTTYASLFTKIGITYGAGDGTTTFALPDLRGQFIRGWDNGAGIDTGRVFGSLQTDELISHKHVLQDVVSGGGGVAGFDLANATGTLGSLSTENIGVYGGAETRPKNVALKFCIKYR